MDEKDFFNKDSMYWREVNIASPHLFAEIELNECIEGVPAKNIRCKLLPFESVDVIYEMENGGAFKKNEVLNWHYVAFEDVIYFEDESNSEADRKAKVRTIEHSKITSITLKNEEGVVALKKAKI